MTTLTIPRQRTITAARTARKTPRPTPWLDLLWLLPLTVASYALALVGGSWIVGVM